jgi:hypothetical protein
MRGQFNPKKELKWCMRYVWTAQKQQDFSTHMSMVSFQPSIIHSAISINGN